MKLELVVAVILLLCVLVVLGCSPHFQCRSDAYARASHVNVGYGVIGSLIVSAVNPPKPHPPLDEMLAECEK